MNRIRLLAACIATLTLPLIGMTAASASAAKPPPGPKLATLACQVTNPACTEPVAALAFPSTDDYVPPDDAALTSNGSSTWLDPDNGQGDGTQDWTFAQIATVPPPGGGPGAFGFTGFDRHNYGLSHVYEIEWTPFGQDTGKCLQDLGARRLHRVGLRACDGGADQAWIVVFHNIPFVLAHPGYAFGLSVLQTANAQHHNCLTGHLFSATTDSRCVNRDINATDTQRWSAIP